jgi:hypothetical protein
MTEGLFYEEPDEGQDPGLSGQLAAEGRRYEPEGAEES